MGLHAYTLAAAAVTLRISPAGYDGQISTRVFGSPKRSDAVKDNATRMIFPAFSVASIKRAKASAF